MTAVIPPHNYHPPRHQPPLTPTSRSTSYYASSASTQPSSYWSTDGVPSTVSTTSSIPSPKMNPGLAAARHVTKAAVRLHKRSISGSKSEEEPHDDMMIDEGFFSGPGSPPASITADLYHPHHSSKTSHRTREKIKPLLKKVGAGSRNNSLDLSRSDGGLPNGVGLGIYDNQGYDSSGVEDDLVHRHRRNFSGASGNSPLLPTTQSANQPFLHPKRQMPRRGAYTPDLSYNGTSNESSDDESGAEYEPRPAVLRAPSRSTSATRGLRLDTNYSGRSTPVIPTLSTTDLPQHIRTPSSTLTSPISPSTPDEVFSLSGSYTEPRPSSKMRRGRSALTAQQLKHSRDPSPSFAASVAAARLAWEAKEEKKEEKREKKRRRSEAKGEERSRAPSRASTRGRGNSGSSGQTNGTVWDDEIRTTVNPGIRGKTEHEDDDVYRGPAVAPSRHSIQDEKASFQSRGRHGTGKKWGVLGAESGRRKKQGFKKRWFGFIVWARIACVRIGRKMGF